MRTKLFRLITAIIISGLHTTSINAETFTIGWSDNFLPICGIKDKKVDGMAIELMNEAFKRIGHKLEHKAFPVKRLHKLLEKGQVSAMVATPTEARAKLGKIGQEQIILRHYHIFTRKGDALGEELSKFKTLDELKPYTRIDFTDNGWTKKHMKEGFKIKAVTRRYQMFKMLAAGRAGKKGYVLENPDLVRAQLKKLGLTDKLQSHSSSIPKLNFGWNIIVSHNQSKFYDLIPKIDQAIKEMKEDKTYQKIVDKWYAMEL